MKPDSDRNGQEGSRSGRMPPHVQVFSTILPKLVNLRPEKLLRPDRHTIDRISQMFPKHPVHFEAPCYFLLKDVLRNHRLAYFRPHCTPVVSMLPEFHKGLLFPTVIKEPCQRSRPLCLADFPQEDRARGMLLGPRERGLPGPGDAQDMIEIEAASGVTPADPTVVGQPPVTVAPVVTRSVVRPDRAVAAV